MKNLKKAIALLVVIGLIAAAGMAIAAESITVGKTVQLTAAYPLKEKALEASNNIQQVKSGTTGKVLKVTKYWVHVNLSGYGGIGYLPKKLVKIYVPKVAPIMAGNQVDFNKDQKMLASASAKAKVISNLKKGTRAKVEYSGVKWTKVKLASNGLTGWVPNADVKLYVPAMTANIIAETTAEWTTSSHGTMTITKDSYMYDFGNGTDCQPCHTGNTLARKDGSFYNPSLNMADNKAADSTKPIKFSKSATTEMPKGIGCETCHSGKGAEILKTGVVPASHNRASGLKMEMNAGTKSALCLTCHSGRRDIAQIYANWTNGVDKKIDGPHHSSGGGVAGGTGAMPITGVTYAQSTAHKDLGCVGCHMSKNAYGYTKHTFKPDVAACKPCHSGITDFDSFAAKIKAELEAKLATVSKLASAKVPPVGGKQAVRFDNGKFYDSLTATATANVVTPPLTTPPAVMVATYNYALIQDELLKGAKGAHNPQYAKSVLDETIKSLEALK